MKRFLGLLIILLLSANTVYAQKVTTLIENTNPTSDDLVYSVDNPGGTPVGRKVTIANLAKGMSYTNITSGNISTSGTVNFGGATLEIPNSITLPATCTVGQIYMDTDATSGQRLYACESTNTWKLQGDGGGSGGGGGAFSDASDPIIQNITTKDVVIGTAAVNASKLSIDGDDDQVQLSIQGNSTQTNSIMIIEDSSGVELMSLTNTGVLTAKSFVSYGTGQSSLDQGLLINSLKGISSDDDFQVNSGTINNILMVDSSADSVIGLGTWNLTGASISLPNDSIGDSEIVKTSVTATKTVTLKPVDQSTALSIGDGAICFVVPAELNGMNLVSVGGHTYTASTSGTPTYQIRNQTDTADMLSTALTIDANEKDSSTATTPAVINTATDDVVTGDEICVDKDVAGTGEKGDEIRLGFQRP